MSSLNPDHEDDLETAMIAVRAFALVLGELMGNDDAYEVVIDDQVYRVMAVDKKITLVALGDYDGGGEIH